MGVRNANKVRRERRGDKLRLIIDFRYVDSAGRTKRFRRDAAVQSTAAARAEAERRYRLAMETGSPEDRPGGMSLRAFAEDQFEKLYMPRYRPETRKRYRGLLKQLLEAIGDRPLEAIDELVFRRYAAELATRGVQLKGPLNIVRTLLRAATEVGQLRELPKLPRLFKDAPKLSDAPSADEVRAFLEHADGWLHTAIAIAAYAGLRVGEVCALEVGDVNLAERLLHVRRAISDTEVVTPKSGKGRTVPIAEPLVAVIAAAIQAKLPRARVVTTATGTTPTRTLVLARLKALAKRHELRERSFHSLRHFFCSELLRSGASVEAVRTLAGHGSLTVTQRYVHASGAELRDAIGRFTGN